MRRVTAVDDSPTVLAEAVQRERAAYLAGRAEAEADMAAHWAVLARRVRGSSDRVRGPIPEPRVREQRDADIWFTAEELAARDGAA